MSVASSENLSPEEKPVLSPQLVLLTQSLREWKAPVCSIPPVVPQVPVRHGFGEERHPVRDAHQVTRLSWTIEKANILLKSGDHIKISPSMEVSLGEGYAPAKFKLMMKPKTSISDRQLGSGGRGGDCFRKAKGDCYIELKCEEGQDVIGKTQFSIWVGNEPARGPVEHNFSNEIVGRLSRDYNNMWDMKSLLGQVPANPEIWDLKTPIAEGCLVLGVEISVLSKSELRMSETANGSSNTESDNPFVNVSDMYPTTIRLSL